MKATWTYLKVVAARVRFLHLVVFAWVIVSVDSLDGQVSPRGTPVVHTDLSVWRALAAWYVLLGGIFILHTIFVKQTSLHHRPRLPLVFAWCLFGFGMFFWSAVALRSPELFVLTGVGALIQALIAARGNLDVPLDAEPVVFIVTKRETND